MTRLTRIFRRIPPATAIALGLIPVVGWLGMTAAGWAPDAQVISGTLDPVSPAASALRGLWIVGARLAALVLSPPLIAGGVLWWAWSANAERSATG